MTATIYKLSDYRRFTENIKTEKSIKSVPDRVIYNISKKTYYVEEESKGVFVWTPNLIESQRLTKEQALLILARLKWWYPDHRLKVRELASMRAVD